MRRVQIEEFIKESGGALLLDVRSPSEYNHAHIPGATSFPLFTDEERKVVGTAYKQKSREAAIKIGLDFFGPKMRGMVEKVEELMVDRWPMERRMTVTDQRTTVNVFIYCWRGGMRSGAVSWLLNMYGFNVTVLAGGYKAFRGYVLQSFELPYHFKILGGYTGSGKTEVLQQLRHAGEAVIDLEGLAAHKGSAFGSINMPPQPTQEMFENRLNSELRKVSGEWSVASDIKTGHTPNPIWLEDESQRIGNLNIPGALWQNMRQSPIYFLDIPFEERLQHITEEYSQCQKQKLTDAIERIKKRLGPLETKTALQYLEDSALKDCFRILLHYYDKHYLKGLHSRQNLSALLTNIISETVTSQNACLVSQAQLLQ
ncbi:MAG TPA: tRNA 2-selenouridine(34) synthase MnmH [Flavisolibacter sp.]|nr:tRNA 2-selenouridine(34) synthase MnmH [Flavisolibacter sp.]